MVLSWCVCGELWTFKFEGLPQLSLKAAPGLISSFNCSELDITHTPTLAKIFWLFFNGKIWLAKHLADFGFQRLG